MTITKSYGKLTVNKLNQTTPSAIVHTSIIGPWKVHFRLSKTKQPRPKKNIINVDRVTAWLKFVVVKRCTSSHVTE